MKHTKKGFTYSNTKTGKKVIKKQESSMIKWFSVIIFSVATPAIVSILIWLNNIPSVAAEVTVPRKEIVTSTPKTVYQQICEATNGENCDVIYNLCKAESGCRKYAVNKNTNSTFDYSYLQVNSVHIIGDKFSKGKGTITMDCAYDLACVSKWANAKIKKGQLHIWVAASKI